MSARHTLLLLSLAAIWGASFLFIAEAVEELAAAGVAEGRVVLALIALVAYAAAVRRLPSLRARWRGYLVLGAVNAALPFLLISAAEETIPASLAAIVNATAPLFSAVIAAVWLAQPVGRRGTIGLALGVAGVAMVVGLAPLHLTLTAGLAILASLAAAAAYGVGGHIVKLRFAGETPLGLAIGQQAGAAVVLAPFLLAIPPRHAPTGEALWAMLALGVVCTGLAYIIYFRLIADLGATSALTVTYLVPVFGVLWAGLFRDERITLGMLAGAAVVLAGVVLVTRGSNRRPLSASPVVGNR